MRAPAPLHRRPHRTAREAGFTLIELMITLLVLAAVTTTLVIVMMTAQRGKTASTNSVESTQSARAAMELMARDLRSAGFGADLDYTANPQPAIAYIDSMQVLMNENVTPYPDTTAVKGQPWAYNPAGSPKPAPLSGTAWAPPIRYNTGAELIRYTLDVNNDGAVDANDQTASEGVDAMRTPNPNDYVLVRQVYGDMTGGSAGNNGGTTERIALVQRPGSGVPPMFRVYLRGSSTPYDWSGGPVPVAQLANIERIEVNVTAGSPKADWRGQYARTVLSTSVNSMRNTPNFGAPTYLVDGYAFEDLNGDRSRQSGEPGVASQLVRLGRTYTCYTSATGYFSFRVPAGTYTLREVAAAPYSVTTTPDSFVVTVPNPQTRSFANARQTGGYVRVLAFNDANGNGSRDTGEPGVAGIRTTLSNGNVAYTDANGLDSVFTGVGAYTVTVSPPDSFIVSNTNPQSGTMVDGGVTNHTFVLSANATGRVQGKVFRDNNRNGTLDAGETGIQNVWVGVTGNAGLTTLGYAYTDVNGDYSITVPINDPPRTSPYTVYCIPPASFFPTATIALGSLWVQNAATLTGKNFGMAAFQIITLNASRVLSLANGNLIEKDWSGNDNQYATKGAGDFDLVLGADAGGTDNISVWFNNYNATPAFSPAPTYTRNAPQSVLALALDTLDTASPLVRPDLVTGTKKALNGNLFVWINQGSSGNLGYFPATFSTGLNYTTQDGGDVTSVLTYDCAGGNMPDIIVGTKSPTAGNGTLEVWQNSNAASPTFTRQETYPSAGSIPGNRLGEVTCMALGDFNGDGSRDLVVGTKTGTYSGSLEFFRYVSKTNGNRFLHAGSYSTAGMAITAITVCDVDGDGRLDVVCGAQGTSSSGKLQFWRNRGTSNGGNTFDFALQNQVDAPGIVQSLVAADYGGSGRQDIAMGWRQDETSYVGGLRIYFTDLGLLPTSGVDPSGGAVTNFVPAMTSNNFNYGVNPSTPAPPYLADLAAGVKISALTGAVYVFIR